MPNCIYFLCVIKVYSFNMFFLLPSYLNLLCENTLLWWFQFLKLYLRIGKQLLQTANIDNIDVNLTFFTVEFRLSECEVFTEYLLIKLKALLSKSPNTLMRGGGARRRSSGTRWQQRRSPNKLRLTTTRGAAQRRRNWRQLNLPVRSFQF